MTNNGTDPVGAIVRHLSVALSRHLENLRRNAIPVPSEIEELANVIILISQAQQDVTGRLDIGVDQHLLPAARLLVTKQEAADLLGVSVRTIERLVASRRLPQVRVERMARIRISDLEAYVKDLSG